MGWSLPSILTGERVRKKKSNRYVEDLQHRNPNTHGETDVNDCTDTMLKKSSTSRVLAPLQVAMARIRGLAASLR